MNTAAGETAMSRTYSIALNIQLACIWEATARKPGNVHRFRDFADTTYVDFVQAAAAVAPILAADPEQAVGLVVFEAVRLSGQVVSTNTNLGIVLLLAPLAKAAGMGDVRRCLPDVLKNLDVADAEWVYAAIRMAKPGGLGHALEQDTSAPPTHDLRAVMKLAAERDLIARQYDNGFRDVFNAGTKAIRRGLSSTDSLEAAIVWGQLSLLASHPDSLIGRKRGPPEAKESSQLARQILAADWPHTTESWELFRDFDAWLRAVGHERNPGTTADLIAASLFVLLQEGRIKLPARFPWPDGFERR
jgi:triphosphoribosyl-dephospho-CoA synthase